MGGAHISNIIFMTCIIFATLFVIIRAHDDIEVENEHPFTYEGNSEKGPDHWGHLNPEWEACESGNLQSPIDLLDEKVEVLSGLGKLRRRYKPAPSVIRNRGHDIMVQWTGDAGGIIINETEHKLIQCHWHTPSEHRIDGRSFNMELHMVHNSSQGQIAVISILYVLGRPDTFLRKLLPQVKSINEKGNELGDVDPWDIKFGSRKYYRYIGSLTVPPCTEGVVWTILKKGFKNNARPTQSWEGRNIYAYHPEL